MKKISIVIPVYQNELNLQNTAQEVIKLQDEFFLKNYSLECIFVNDGSTDRSYEILEDIYQKYINLKLFKVIKFTKNFGQIYAIEAGIANAVGDFIGFISADLQDPIELFSTMIDLIEVGGNELVVAKRESREDTGIGKYFSKLTHYLVHKYINKDFPKGGYDFCLFSKKLANRILETKERNGQLPILLMSFGYKYHIIGYTRQKRDIGKSQWTFSKKLKLFIDIFTSNSYLPLRMVSTIGTISSFISIIYLLYVLLEWLLFQASGEPMVRGWTTIVLLITFYSGLILLSIGIIGEYIWRILDEVKNKDRFIIEHILGDENDQS